MDKKTRAILLKNAASYQFCIKIDDARFQNLIELIYTELEDSGSFPGRGSRVKQLHQLTTIIANLIRIYKVGYNPFLRISKRPEHYKKSRYVPKSTSFRAAVLCLKGLEELSFVKVYKGYAGKRRRKFQTRIRVDRKLRSLFEIYKASEFRVSYGDDETIILRDKDKELVDYTDTTQTNNWRKNLELVNEKLRKHSVDLYIKDTDFRKLNKELALAEDSKPIDFSRKRLRRIFNNSSWDQGGRFYHGWWMGIPKSYRKYIYIDDKATVEVDFASMHPNMLYAIYASKELSFDPYLIDPSGKISRSLGKTIFNILINSSDRINGFGAIREALKTEGLPADSKEVNQAIYLFESKHSNIAKAFFSGAGLKLQYTDSQVAEKVLLYYTTETEYVVLPMHDSFLAHHALAEELKDKMIEIFKDMTGIEITIGKTKPYFGAEDVTGLGVKEKVVTKDFDELLKYREEYAGYYKRIGR